MQIVIQIWWALVCQALNAESGSQMYRSSPKTNRDALIQTETAYSALLVRLRAGSVEQDLVLQAATGDQTTAIYLKALPS